MAALGGARGRVGHLMGIVHAGVKNPNWRGGRVVDQRGYVLVRVGVDHHLADIRGYAYEHRLVAERKLGRRLRRNEEVHHDDENRSNNHPDNLIVARNHHDHARHHRTTDKRLRNPGERNPTVRCACGCGIKFRRFDGDGRARRYVSGHNTGARNGR